VSERVGISAVLLAYKEAENLRVLLPRIREQVEPLGEPYEIVVVDTAQPLDDTPEVCREFGARYVNQESPGFGGAFRTGIRAAEMARFLILDSDGSHDPAHIPEIYRKFTEEKCDVVIGSRYVRGGKTLDAPLSVLMSKTLNATFRVCLGIRAHDVSTDFRMYDTAQLKQVELSCVNYDVLQEVLLKLRLRNRGLRIGEVPIVFRKRLFGDSKRRLLPFIASYARSLFRLTAERFFGGRARPGAEILRNIFLYGVFGGVAAGIDYGVFTLSTAVGGVAPEVANVLGGLCGFTFTFLANTFLNFRKPDRILRRLASYGGICLIGLALSTSAITLLKDVMDLYVLKAVVLVVVSALQFVLNRTFTYR
jgi:dolichol-phosphate mannosyltransferase